MSLNLQLSLKWEPNEKADKRHAFIFYPVYNPYSHLWMIIWCNVNCRRILYWSSSPLFKIIKKKSAVWLVRQARMFCKSRPMGCWEAFPQASPYPKLTKTMIESITCPGEMPEQKNSAGNRVFIIHHNICPGDQFPQNLGFSPVSSITVKQQYFCHCISWVLRSFMLCWIGTC